MGSCSVGVSGNRAFRDEGRGPKDESWLAGEDKQVITEQEAGTVMGYDYLRRALQRLECPSLLDTMVCIE